MSQHQKFSKKKLSYFDSEIGDSYVPYVVETSVGLDRLFLSVICGSFIEEKVGGEPRVVLKLPPYLSPVSLAVLPLVKKDGLTERARQIFDDLKLQFSCHYEEKDSIGKRYRRQDAIGTPFCITIDHDTLTDDHVTLRERDTMNQERIAIENLSKIITAKLDI